MLDPFLQLFESCRQKLQHEQTARSEQAKLLGERIEQETSTVEGLKEDLNNKEQQLKAVRQTVKEVLHVWG